jgi:uncharacterized membrane protein YfhO
MLAFLKGLESRRWLVAAAILESIMIYEGGTYVFAYSVLFLFVFAIGHALTTSRWKPIVNFVAINILAVSFAAPKLIPVLDLLSSHPRIIATGKAISWDDFLAFFIERDSNMGSNTWEYGSYVGIMAVILYIFSIATLRKHMALVFSSLFMMLIALGNFASFAPWTLLHGLPFFRNFQLPSRSLIVVCFTMALLVGLYLTRWVQNDSKLVSLSVAGLVLFMGIDLLCYTQNICKQATIPAQVTVFRLNGPTRLDKPAELYRVAPTDSTGIGRSVTSVHQPFSQISVPDLKRYIHGAWSDQYLPLLQNKGVIDAYETIQFEHNALPVGHKEYKGEYHLVNDGEVNLLNWSPNKLIFHLRLKSADRLVINQNYWKGWHTSLGAITNHNGLLAIDLPPGEYEVALKYFPDSLIIGICLFCLTVTGVILFLFRDSRVSNKGLSPNPSH